MAWRSRWCRRWRPAGASARTMAATFEPPKEEEEGESLSDQLEKLLAKYEDSEALQAAWQAHSTLPRSEDGSTQSTGHAEPGDPELLAQLEEHVAACGRVRDHLGHLLPVLDGDKVP